MNNSLKKNILTHTLIILSFFIVNILVQSPSFFEGKKLNQHDILQARGGNKNLVTYRDQTGDDALWNNHTFSGMPAYLTGVRYSGDFLKHAYFILRIGLGHPESILFTAQVCFYILLLSFRVRPLIAAIGAIVFALNGFNTIGLMAGHNAKIAAVALMPLVLAGIHLTFSGKRWLGFGLTALALGLEISVNHPQITYYLVIIVVAYGINLLVKAIKEKSYPSLLSNVGLMVIAAALAVGANYGRLATMLEYGKYSIRGESELVSDQKASSGLDKEYAFRYSNGIVEPLFLFVPNVFGGSSQQELSPKSNIAEALRKGRYNRSQIAQQIKSIPTYWGSQPLTAPYYAGTLTIILFILGIIILPRSQKVWLIALVVVGIIMSWGKNFESINYFLFDYLPGYNKFRSVTFTIIISIFALNLLGFIGLEKFISNEWNSAAKKQALMAIGISGGFLIVLMLFSGVLGYRGAIDSQLPDWFLDALKKDRRSLLLKDAFRALMFMGIFTALIWTIVKEKIKTNYALILVILIAFIDSFSLTKRFLGSEKFAPNPTKSHFQMTEADQAIASQISLGERVLNLQNPFNENRTSYYFESIGGYHGAKIRRYQDIIDHCIQSELQSAYQTLQNQSFDFSGLQVLNMLNTKILYAGAQRNAVFPNQYANGNAWTVAEVIPVNSPNEEIDAVCSINTKTQAVVDQSKFQIANPSGSGKITLTNKAPNKVEYTASINGGTALGVFSEIYYLPGWTAFIDGKETEVLRANYILRALEIPSGNHEIIFEFKPKSYHTGNKVMMACSILVLLVFVGASIFEMININFN